MNTAISLPDDLFEAAEHLASRLGTTRSGLHTQALSEFVAKHRTDTITEQLNAVYDEAVAEIDTTVAQIQTLSIARKW